MRALLESFTGPARLWPRACGLIVFVGVAGDDLPRLLVQGHARKANRVVGIVLAAGRQLTDQIGEGLRRLPQGLFQTEALVCLKDESLSHLVEFVPISGHAGDALHGRCIEDENHEGLIGDPLPLAGDAVL